MSCDNVEAHVRGVAALLGVADFVYSPTVVPKGKATREVSDGMLLCRQGRVVLQVKARERAAAAGDDADAAARWVRKQCASAIEQGKGTLRTIRVNWEAGEPVRAVAVRALNFAPERRAEFAVPLSEDPSGWPIAVILDHPLIDGIDVPLPDGVFAITPNDWRELNRSVRSVNGLVRYIHRVLEIQASGPFTLGHERDRFVEVARADRGYAAERDVSVPWFTLGTHEDIGVELYRELLERVWMGDARGPALSASECRLILDFLDDVPVALQVRVGRWILEKRSRLDATGERQSGVVLVGDRPLLYACETEANEPDRRRWKAELTALTAVRLLEWQEQRGTETPAVCIGVRQADGGVEYTHIYADAKLGFDVPPEVRADIEDRYGVPTLTTP